MSLINRQPREVYRVYDPEQLADESAWAADDHQENTQPSPQVPDSGTRPVRVASTSPSAARPVLLTGALLVGAIAVLLFSQMISGGAERHGRGASRSLARQPPSVAARADIQTPRPNAQVFPSHTIDKLPAGRIQVAKQRRDPPLSRSPSDLRTADRVAAGGQSAVVEASEVGSAGIEFAFER